MGAWERNSPAAETERVRWLWAADQRAVIIEVGARVPAAPGSFSPVESSAQRAKGGRQGQAGQWPPVQGLGC